jgi:hypothetical protein
MLADLGDLPDDAVLSARDLGRLGFGHHVTLCRQRARGDGPPFIKLSEHRIGYVVRDLRAWMRSRRVETGKAA